MSLWDELPAGLRNSGELDSLRPLLDGLNGTGPVEETDADGSWSVYTATENLKGALSLDPQTGAFSTSSGSSGTPIEFPDPTVSVTLGFHLTGPGGTRDGGWRVILGAPSVLLKLPFLRGAMLDGQGQLRADPANPIVRITLPSLRIRVQQLSGSSVGVKLLSATTGGPPVDQIYDFISMNPPYALVGPSDVVGFAFRTAVLDLSGTAGPTGVPATARAMPGDWQGLYLPEARLFVAPGGLEGIAVSAGVREMWIGIGAHGGVTGIFEAEVVNRGGTPTISVRFATATGAGIADPGVGSALLPEHCTLFVDTAGGIAPISLSINVDGTVTNDDRVELTTPAVGALTITVTARDGAGHPTSRTFTAARQAAAVGAGGSGAIPTVTPTSTGTHRMERVSFSPTKVTVGLVPSASATWTWAGGTSTGTTAEVPVAAGAQVDVTAVLTAVAPKVIEAFYLFDQPSPSEVPEPRPAPVTPEPGLAWADNPVNVHTEAAGSRTNPGSSATLLSTLAARLADIGAATPLTVHGYASFENDDVPPQPKRNFDLSERRRDTLVHLLRAAGFTGVTVGTAHGHVDARDHTAIDAVTPAPAAGASGWWRARAVTAASSAETVTGRVHRPAAPPAPHTVDPRPPARGTPDCFRKIGVRVELVRSTFIRGEIYGEFDIETATEAGLARKGQGALRSNPASRNPSDGICLFLVRLRIAKDQNSWNITAEFRAAEADLDGLAKMDVGHSNPNVLNVLGALTVLAPLTSATTELSPAAGALVALGSIALGASDLISTQSIILRGGELVVSQGIVGADGTTTVTDRGTQVSVLLDVEVSFTFDLGIVKVDPAHPITTRYKAVGFRSQWGTNNAPQGVEYIPLPVFDPSRGYSLDIPTGSLTASPPLDDILRILGVKVSKDNPTYLEVEVGMGLDLGIIKVDTVRVRGRLDGPPLDLQLTKLGATLDIPGVLHGSGWVAITDLGFKGSFDLTIVPVNVRGSASFALESKDGVTGVLIGVEVEFPVPILLGNSGLGLFGLMGGVGVNYARNENPAVQVPALAWLQQQFARVGGVMDPDGWTLTPGHYAFAAGVLLGTLEGGYVVHLKGIIIIEVPGPRLLLVMKADVLSAPPVLNSNQSATFLAVLDIDFGRGTITIGIVAAYEIESILKIRVPVTAFFDARNPENWLVELGNYSDRVTVEVLDVISGSGYLMVHGNGITIPGLPPVSSGLAIAAGFHIQAVLMGSKAVGLYLEVAAGFDAIVGFDPFFIAGKIYVKGELRLFIISIGASAELTVMVGKRVVNGVEEQQPYVHGEVCGEVDFFFFSVKGCVSLTIGAEPDKTPVPKDLIAGVSLISRSPALLEGSATDRAVDGKVADAHPTDPEDPGHANPVPLVPLDVIPAILFHTAPLATGPIVMGAAAFGQSGAAANPWTRIGDRWWAYELVSVTLQGALLPPTGKTPATWWVGAPPQDPADGPALALLDWLPTPFSRAIPYGQALTDQVHHRWGTVCNPAAPPARVLWTFDHKPLGPSEPGWKIAGVPWPDPPGTLRTAPVAGELNVTERWRCGDSSIDRLAGVQPATIVGDAVPCFHGQRPEGTDLLGYWAKGQPTTFSGRRLGADAAAVREVVGLLAGGLSLGDVSAAHGQKGWDPDLTPANHGQVAFGCDGRILQSPAGEQPDPVPFGTEQDRKRVETAWNDLGHKPDALGDAVRLHEASGFSEFAGLLLLPERALVGSLVVRYENAKGTKLGEFTVTPAHRVSSTNPIPTGWFDPAGPWADPIERAGRIAARVVMSNRQPLMLVLINDPKPPKGTTDIVIGWDRAVFKNNPTPPFWVIAMSGLVSSEVARASWDTTVTSSEQTALSNALTQDPFDVALLTPGTPYTVDVVWRAAFLQQEARPTVTPSGWTPNHTQSYQFTADGIDKAPTELSPWLLATTPGMNDVGIFRKEPVRIALATQKVAALFDAYGKELRVMIRCASGKHPEPPGGGSPGGPLTLAVDPTMFAFGTKGTDFRVLAPWFEAVGEMVDRLPCIGVSGADDSSYTITLPYDFEPLTDYLIDVHAVPKGAPANATGLIHRIGFTTSRFANVEELAGNIAPAAINHRVLITPSALTNPASLPDHPTGAQMDAAFQAAGLAAPQTPEYPAVFVLWSPDAVPQPVAVVVESSEPLWRSRLIPTEVFAPPDASDPTHKWWAARPADWLFLANSTTPPAGGDLPRAAVTRVVQGPGSTRAIVLLGAGARGAEVRLDLVSAADKLAVTPEKRTTAVRVSLLHAPWEVED
jgi:large repetitive protein